MRVFTCNKPARWLPGLFSAGFEAARRPPRRPVRSLHNFIHGPGGRRFTYMELLTICGDVAAAMAYLHPTVVRWWKTEPRKPPRLRPFEPAAAAPEPRCTAT